MKRYAVYERPRLWGPAQAMAAGAPWAEADDLDGARAALRTVTGFGLCGFVYDRKRKEVIAHGSGD